MKRTWTSIPDTEFQEIYSWLLYFSRNFDDAADHVPAVLEGIATAYIAEQKRLYNRDLTMEQAVSVLSQRPINVRHAGRRARVTEEDKAVIRAALEDGQKLEDIARTMQVSVSYVQKIRNGRIK